MALFPSREAHLPLSLCCVLAVPCLLLPWLGTRAPWVAPHPGRRRGGPGRECLGTGRTGPGVLFGFGGGGEGRDPVGWLFSHATSRVAQLVKNPPAGWGTRLQGGKP